MRIWQMRQARVKLSEVIRCASLSGPQILTRRGVEVAVVLSHAEYLQLKGKQASLSEFFRRSPLGELDLEREQSPRPARQRD